MGRTATQVLLARMSSVEVHGLRVHYQDFGPADAASGIVLVHGLGSSSHIWDFVAAHPDRAAGLVLVDGGTGSPGERWSWAETESRLRPPDLDGMLWSDLHQ